MENKLFDQSSSGEKIWVAFLRKSQFTHSPLAKTVASPGSFW
jgi:hypothetical protein